MPSALLEPPILIALLLSLAFHFLIWKVLPETDPLPQGKSHGLMRARLIDSEGGSPSNDSWQPSKVKPKTIDTNLAKLNTGDLNQSTLSSEGNVASLASQNTTQETDRSKGRQWETQMRIQVLQHLTQVNQAIGFFQAQQMPRGRFFCELFLNADYSIGYVHCDIAQAEQALKVMLGGTGVRWQDNKNGLPNDRSLGQPVTPSRTSD